MSDFFINDAWAQTAQQQGGGWSFLFMMAAFFVIFYFLLIRPQQKQAREHREMIESLKVGEEIVTTGGVLGRIKKIGNEFLTVEIARDIEIKVQKNSVSQEVPKGTMKEV